MARQGPELDGARILEAALPLLDVKSATGDRDRLVALLRAARPGGG